eukprot:1157179-Pelagomonas_calceolata.AAC.6
MPVGIHGWCQNKQPVGVYACDLRKNERDAMASQVQYCGCEAQTRRCVTVCMTSSHGPRKNPPSTTMQLWDSKQAA